MNHSITFSLQKSTSFLLGSGKLGHTSKKSKLLASPPFFIYAFLGDSEKNCLKFSEKCFEKPAQHMMTQNQHNTQTDCKLFYSSQYPQLNGREPSSAYHKILIFKPLKPLCQAQRSFLGKIIIIIMQEGKKDDDLKFESKTQNLKLWCMNKFNEHNSVDQLADHTFFLQQIQEDSTTNEWDWCWCWCLNRQGKNKTWIFPISHWPHWKGGRLKINKKGHLYWMVMALEYW